MAALAEPRTAARFLLFAIRVGELQLIDIVGLNEGQEYEAALHLRWLLLKLWPDLAQSRKDSIKIFVGLKFYGYKLEDLDLVLVGRFSDYRPFDVEYAFHPRNGEPFVPRQAFVRGGTRHSRNSGSPPRAAMQVATRARRRHHRQPVGPSLLEIPLDEVGALWHAGEIGHPISHRSPHASRRS